MVQKVGLEGPKSLKSLVKVSLVRSLSPFGPFGLVVGAVWSSRVAAAKVPAAKGSR